VKGRFKFVLAVFAGVLIAAGCRHHQAAAPAVATAAPAQHAPEVRVAPPADFVAPSTKVATDDLGDASHATQLAETRGWLRDAYFDFDSSLLRADARENLTESEQWLKSHPKYDLMVEGHCDERGTEQYNLALGEKRAWEARTYLGVLGYDTDRIKTISYGKDRPLDDGHNEEAWSKNRCAHLVLTATK